MLWLISAIITSLVLILVVKINSPRKTQRKQQYKHRQQQAQQAEIELNNTNLTIPPTLPSRPVQPLIGKPPLSVASAAEIDYTHLQTLLVAMRWQEADTETRKIMLKLANCQAQGYIDLKSMQNIPCIDLRSIDSLWLNYSNCHFGFSIQNYLWQKSEENCNRFGDLVGWRKNGVFISQSELIYNLSSPPGHLPVAYIPIVGNCLWTVLDSISSLNQQLVHCYQQDR